MQPALLLQRLEDIAQGLQRSQNALGLLALGSVGPELERLDSHSDLDFFALVKPGYKASYLQDLSWLSYAAPIAYAFANTADGYKLLYSDGIFCEFAVFEAAELSNIPYALGRLVWYDPALNPEVVYPAPQFLQAQPHPLEWHLGEALTNLLVGLKRFNRGEKLSAMRFVQSYALDRVIDLAKHLENPQPYWADPFAAEWRFEQGFPHTARLLPQIAQGYEHTPASALAILQLLEQHFTVNPVIANAIRQEAQGG